MQLSISINPSLSKLAKAIGEGVNPDTFLRDEIYKIALKIERVGKQLTPVDTGRLRASIATGMLINRVGAFVSTNVNYALYVHEGTKYIRPRPFLETGANMVKDQIEGDLSSRVDAEFAKAFKKL